MSLKIPVLRVYSCCPQWDILCSTSTWGCYQTGATLNYNTFAVWRLSGYVGSWDSSHRLCMCWLELRVQQNFSASPRVPGQDVAHQVRPLSTLRSLAHLGANFQLLLSQARSRPPNAGGALGWAQLLPYEAVCSLPSGPHCLFVFLDPQPNKAWKRHFLFLN